MFQKYLISLLFLVFALANTVSAQDVIFSLQPASGLTEKMRSDLDKKMRDAFARHQFARDDDFAMTQVFPYLTFSNGIQINAGSSPMKMVVGSFACVVRLREGGTVFGQYTARETGQDANDSLAQENVLSHINFDNEQFDSFALVVKKKILAHFDAKCAKMMNTANEKSAAGDMRTAYTQLANIPLACKCRAEADTLMGKLYVKNRDEMGFVLFGEKQRCSSEKRLFGLHDGVKVS